MSTPEIRSHGVDALIEKLRNDGVAAGKTEAERVVSEARVKAAKIISDAKSESDKYLSDSRKSADNYRVAGEEALNIAMRDATLNMKAALMKHFESDLERMVSSTLADPEMLKQMILELVGSVRDASGIGKDAKVILPAKVPNSDEIRKNVDAIQSDQLTQFTLGLSQKVLEEGVTLHFDEDLGGGIHAQCKDDGIILDLSDEAVTSMLMQHLQPRFRAVLEGVIK